MEFSWVGIEMKAPELYIHVELLTWIDHAVQRASKFKVPVCGCWNVGVMRLKW